MFSCEFREIFKNTFFTEYLWVTAYCYKKDNLRNFAKFTAKHSCRSILFIKVAVLRPATFLKKRLRHRCFPVNFAKISRNIFWWFEILGFSFWKGFLCHTVPNQNWPPNRTVDNLVVRLFFACFNRKYVKSIFLLILPQNSIFFYNNEGSS